MRPRALADVGAADVDDLVAGDEVPAAGVDGTGDDRPAAGLDQGPELGLDVPLRCVIGGGLQVLAEGLKPGELGLELLDFTRLLFGQGPSCG
jgi:hypothetical protein